MSVNIHADLPVGFGAGAGGDDALGRDDAGGAADKVFVQGGAVGVAQAVSFVVNEDERLGFFVQLQQGFVFGAGHVAIDDEEDGVSLAGDVSGEFGTFLAVDFVDTGGVDEVHAAAVVFLPEGLFAVAGFAVQDAGGEDVAPGQRV